MKYLKAFNESKSLSYIQDIANECMVDLLDNNFEVLVVAGNQKPGRISLVAKNLRTLCIKQPNPKVEIKWHDIERHVINFLNSIKCDEVMITMLVDKNDDDDIRVFMSADDVLSDKATKKIKHQLRIHHGYVNIDPELKKITIDDLIVDNIYINIGGKF